MPLKTEDVSLNGSGVAVHHPLDPLTAGEITEVTRVLEDHFQWGKDLRVETIDINEPAKDVVRHYDPKNMPPRIARFNAYRHGVMGVWQGLVDLGSAKVISKTFREKARPMLAVQEILDIEALVKADARFQEALRRRGLLAELEYMCVDPWTTGDFNIPIEQGRRVLNCFVFMRTFPLDNFYAHPVEGLHALIDVSTLEVLDVHDHFEADGDYIPVPRTPLNYDAELLQKFRKPSSRLDIVQPDGAGFVVHGNQVTWENWDFRVGFNGREGLVLYTIGYTQDGKRRPIVYRASIAEMVVPYGTPERSHYRKNVFDSGELGFGRMANSLDPGLRLSGRDPLFRCRGIGSVWPSAHHREVHLPARGRCRHVVEAFRSAYGADRGAAGQEAGDLLHFDHWQLRVCVLLVSASGWAH